MASDPVVIRDATPHDWPSIHPFFAEIVAAGETFACPEGMSPEEARDWWMASPPGRTVGAVDGDAVTGSATVLRPLAGDGARRA